THTVFVHTGNHSFILCAQRRLKSTKCLHPCSVSSDLALSVFCLCLPLDDDNCEWSTSDEIFTALLVSVI
ncbi:hypothetical protein T02_7273, partial [Trichinella nativa]